MNSNDLVRTTVLVEKKISQASAEDVWHVLADFKKYPQFMENVKEVNTFTGAGKSYSEWHVEVEEAPIFWRERDFFKKEEKKIEFEAIEGDFVIFKGFWKIEDHDLNPTIQFNAEYSLGIPHIDRALGHILKEKLYANIYQMMEAIEKEITDAE